VGDLLGPSVIAWGSHFFCKMPGDGKTVSWHQDASYWPLTPSKAVTVWLAIDGIETFGEPVDVELKAGEASIHSDLLLHGSEANASDRRRCGLTLRYTPGDVRAYLGWADKGVVAAGPPPEHWANRPRPTEE
jgi:non-heme Fe2+,alpha-ketoglutarate-dependent halogenase